MHHAPEAGYLHGNREGCLKGTRKDVLWRIEYWLTCEQDQHVFWLNGLPGTGKSTIAYTFAETSFADGKLGATFFCSRHFEDRSNLHMILPTLSFQLALRYPSFRQELLRVLRANPYVGREALSSQMEKLIAGPLQATQIPTLIIIDALDECRGKEPTSTLLSVLSHYMDKIPLVKFFITACSEPRIDQLRSLLPTTEVFNLSEVPYPSVERDIRLFFETKLSDIAKTQSDVSMEDWPSTHHINVLCKKAGGLFIYASTVIKFIASQHYLPDKRLELIINLPNTFHEGRLHDPIYSQILEQAVNNADVDNEDFHSCLKIVLGAISLVFIPLSVKTLSDLLRISDISTTLCPLNSLLLIPTDEAAPVHILHKSLFDFLTDPVQCGDKWFFVDTSACHTELLLSCVSLMKEKLKRNICNLDDYTLLSEIRDLPARQEHYIGDALKYACYFWANHLMEVSSPSAEGVKKVVDNFFETCFLYWIEVLCLTGNLSAGVHALGNVQRWYILVSSE